MDKNQNIYSWLGAHFDNPPDTSLASVEFDNDELRLTCPKGHMEAIGWKDLRRVVILTTDLGPTLDDIFYMFEIDRTVCPFPSEASGKSRLLDYLFTFPNFNSEEFSAAMASTDNAEFLCWEKDKET